MRKVLFITLGILLLTGAAFSVLFVFFQPKPDVKIYEPLLSPAISSKPDQKMIEVRVKGDPNKVLPGAFGALFQAYFGIKDAPKGPNQVAPRLRIEGADVMSPGFTSKDWDLVLGMPVPESVSELPKADPKSAYKVELSTWRYGEVAEILHIGPYDKEQPTIKKLLDYAEDKGYEPIGIHEEEYILGPGMLFVAPEGYYTIIRYPVKKSVKPA